MVSCGKAHCVGTFERCHVCGGVSCGGRDIGAWYATALAGTVGARNAVEQAGLAGSVRADDRQQFAGVDGQRYVVRATIPPKLRETLSTSRIAIIPTTAGCGDIASRRDS